MELYGNDFTSDELRRHVGNMDQIAAVRVVQLEDGNERPGRAALIHTGSGLQLTVLLDRCLDISAASFQGRAMGWRSTTGDVAPQFFEPEGIRWLRSYFGGLVTTCGLTNVGAPAPGSELSGRGLHGRIGHTPARNLQVRQEWQGEEYILSVTGTMRETSVFGENLTLTRTVYTTLGAERFWIEDVVVNEGFTPTPFMLLYHCNIGWPAVGEGSEMLAPTRQIAPRDAAARTGQESWNRMDAPTHQYAEKAYYHDMAPDPQGYVTVAMLNNGFATGDGFGVYLKYHQAELPRFVQWKQMGEQDYVVGFEPCNCGVEGRDKDEARDLLHTLQPGESRRYRLEFGAVTTSEQAEAIRAAIGKRTPQFAESYEDFTQPPAM
jgi:hypothetical protein